MSENEPDLIKALSDTIMALPRVTGEGLDDPYASRWGGWPLLCDGQDWPQCKPHGEHDPALYRPQFLCQIRLSDLPDDMPKRGLLPATGRLSFFGDALFQSNHVDAILFTPDEMAGTLTSPPDMPLTLVWDYLDPLAHDILELDATSDAQPITLPVIPLHFVTGAAHIPQRMAQLGMVAQGEDAGPVTWEQWLYKEEAYRSSNAPLPPDEAHLPDPMPRLIAAHLIRLEQHAMKEQMQRWKLDRLTCEQLAHLYKHKDRIKDITSRAELLRKRLLEVQKAGASRSTGSKDKPSTATKPLTAIPHVNLVGYREIGEKLDVMIAAGATQQDLLRLAELEGYQQPSFLYFKPFKHRALLKEQFAKLLESESLCEMVGRLWHYKAAHEDIKSTAGHDYRKKRWANGFVNIHRRMQRLNPKRKPYADVREHWDKMLRKSRYKDWIIYISALSEQKDGEDPTPLGDIRTPWAKHTEDPAEQTLAGFVPDVSTLGMKVPLAALAVEMEGKDSDPDWCKDQLAAIDAEIMADPALEAAMLYHAMLNSYTRVDLAAGWGPHHYANHPLQRRISQLHDHQLEAIAKTLDPAQRSLIDRAEMVQQRLTGLHQRLAGYGAADTVSAADRKACLDLRGAVKAFRISADLAQFRNRDPHELRVFYDTIYHEALGFVPLFHLQARAMGSDVPPLGPEWQAHIHSHLAGFVIFHLLPDVTIHEACYLYKPGGDADRNGYAESPDDPVMQDDAWIPLLAWQWHDLQQNRNGLNWTCFHIHKDDLAAHRFDRILSSGQA